MSNLESLIKCLEPEKIKRDKLLSEYVNLGVGGKADLIYTTETSADLVKAVRLARSFDVPVTVIGSGTGVVISDKGVRGLVIINRSERVQIKPKRSIFDIFRKKEVTKAEVVVDSGVEIEKVVDKLLDLGILGFERMASLTGTIGAVISDGEGRDGLVKVSVLDEHSGVRSIDTSKEIKGVVIDVTYHLGYGKTEEVRRMVEKQRRKKRYLLNSSGKVFESINESEQLALGYRTRDPGYIVGEILNMKGFSVGKMMISKGDSNIIENLGGGKTEEFVSLVEEIKRRAREAIGIELVEKVVRVGEF